MHEIDLHGDGRLTAVLSHEEVRTIFPLTVQAFERINSLTKQVLKDVDKYPHDKATIELGKLRSRTLLGATQRSVASRTFTASLRNIELNRRYATNLVILWDRESGHPYCIMDGDPIYDFRTASTAAVGVECLDCSKGSVVCILGAGPVARATAFAMGSLPHPPDEIRMTARRKGSFKTITDRFNTLFKSFDPTLFDKTRLIACETLHESLDGSTIIVDAISLSGKGPLLDERSLSPEMMKEITYVDVGKQALANSLIPKFSSYVFDNLDIGYRLSSPASQALREGRCNVSAKKCDLTQLLNGKITAEEIPPARLLTIMGVASVDAEIAEDGYERFSRK